MTREVYFDAYCIANGTRVCQNRLIGEGKENVLLLIILDETIKEFVNFIVKNMNHKDYTVIFL